jgi:CDP-diacylglycerol---serine O-phosphatidyltransferase
MLRPELLRQRRRHRRRRMRVRPMGGWSLNRMIPNILTLLALCAGMTAIRLAFDGRFEAAVTAIIIAGVFDGLDGRIARLLKGISSFGAQLDSLSDFVSFGVAPAVLLYLWTMDAMQSLGWALVLLFAVCCALRLARFNTQIGADLPPYAYNFFTGVPAPAGAGLVMIPMMLWFEFGVSFFRSPIFNGVVLAVVGALMVSRVPTVSLKRFRVPKEWVLPFLLAVGLSAAFLTTEPWGTLLVVGLAYIVSIPVGIHRYLRLKRTAEDLRSSTRELEPPQEEGGRSPNASASSA